MASSHKLKNPNGDSEKSSQEKSIDVRIQNQNPVIQTLDGKLDDNSKFDIELNEYVEGVVEHYEKAGEGYRQSLKRQEDSIRRQNQYIPEYKFDFDDVLITPKAQTNISSRYNGQVNPYNTNPKTFGFGMLPLFTAPMDSVVNHKNAYIFQSNRINVVIPRTDNHNISYSAFSSYGLTDKPRINANVKYILLDIANGHMSSALQWCSKIKKEHPHVQIMAGNIANPESYKIYCDSGVIDFARVGIGNGNGCLTTQQTGIGYPMGSLIAECYEIKKHFKYKVKIVADGGMKKPADIIKALALGADYVMIGSMFSKALESSSPTRWKGIKLNPIIAYNMYNMGFNLTKEFRGMSTKQVQKALGKKELKTSEGVVRKYNVEYKLSTWVENFEHYLRSSMSYTNANSLENFIGQVDYTIISNNAFNRYNK